MVKSVAHVLAGILVVAAAACSDAPRRSPTGPTALPETPLAAAPGSGSWTATASAPAKPAGRGKANKVGGEGTVASLSGVCPDIAMIVRGVRVTTDSSTVFEDGECGNLRPGTKVLVEGEMGADGVVATLVRLLDQPGGQPVAGEGTVGSRKGSCPTLTLVVHGYPVMTSLATTFTGGACEDVVAGTRIRVVGTIVANSVMASEIEILP